MTSDTNLDVDTRANPGDPIPGIDITVDQNTEANTQTDTIDERDSDSSVDVEVDATTDIEVDIDVIDAGVETNTSARSGLNL